MYKTESTNNLFCFLAISCITFNRNDIAKQRGSKREGSWCLGLLLTCVSGPILSVFPALIVHSELKSVQAPDFQWHLFFKHKLINK